MDTVVKKRSEKRCRKELEEERAKKETEKDPSLKSSKEQPNKGTKRKMDLSVKSSKKRRLCKKGRRNKKQMERNHNAKMAFYIRHVIVNETRAKEMTVEDLTVPGCKAPPYNPELWKGWNGKPMLLPAQETVGLAGINDDS